LRGGKYRTAKEQALSRRVSAPRLAVGLISGTSMDGVDAALIRISGPFSSPRVQPIAFTSVEYPVGLRRRILRAAAGGAVTAGEIAQLNFLLGEIFAEAAIEVCRQARTRPQRLAVIGSHGQTVYHQGDASRESGRQVRSTLQLAEPAVIAARTGAPVVADFRKADLAAGGQGAPLVPLMDYLLLRDRSQGTVALNIGGIANVTVIPAAARPGQVTGFDTGPGNMVMDALVHRFTRGRKGYDAEGRLAAEGKVIPKALDEILRLPYFRRRPPKSAGREQFGAEFAQRYFLEKWPHAEERDLVRTANELTAQSIARALRDFVFPEATIDRLIVSGGGSHNHALMARLRELLPQLSARLSDDFGLPVDAKEAMAFAVLADRTLHGLTGNLPSATGARRAVVLGVVSPVPKHRPRSLD
jgi:anhydro-N-acetylmuramic acid kinase